ncbi:MAG: HlyD family secretion protein [Pseudomonadota bacterium]
MSDHTDAGEAEGSSEPKQPSKLREGLIVILALAVGAALLFGIYIYWHFERGHPSTQNAYIQANYVWISPQIDGEVAELFVVENQFVQAGDKLLALDPRLFAAQLEAAKANLVLVQQSIEAGAAKVEAAKAEVEEQQAALKTAQQVAERTKPLVEQDVLTVLQGIEADNALLEAQAKLKTAQAELVVAEKEYGTQESIQAQLQQAQAAVNQAQLNSDWTVVVAPANGYVANLTLRVGDVVQAADNLFPFVESDDWWVAANFKETNVDRIKPGQPVTVKIDMYADREFKGTVTSIGPSSAASFSLLPAQNTTGNWVKVTQRIPVRIRLDEIEPDYPYRLGASVEVEVNTDDPTQSDNQ